MSGFGSGMLITLFIVPVIGPKAVVPVMSVLMLINNGSRVWFYRHAINYKKIVLMVIPAIPAVVIGAHIYVRLESNVIQILLGIILILLVPIRRWISGKKIEAGTKTLLVGGAFFGFLSSIMVGAGTLVIPLLMGAGLLGPALLATDAALAVIVNLSKVVVFGKLDALTTPFFFLAVGMGICTIPGTWVASVIIKKTDIKIHTIFIEILIVLGGGSMIARSVMG